MRTMIEKIFPNSILNLTDTFLKILPTKLKMKYHNLQWEPPIDFIVPATCPQKFLNYRLPSITYRQNTESMDFPKAFHLLAQNIEYHLKLDHSYLVMVDYLDSDQIKQLVKIAETMNKATLAVSANDFGCVFYKEFFKKSCLYIIFNTSGFTKDADKTFEHFNKKLKNELMYGKQTIVFVYDETVATNRNLYYRYHENLETINKLMTSNNLVSRKNVNTSELGAH